MNNVYVFKVKLKHSKRIWRRIEIKENQTLGNFDGIIREAFGHSTWDHLSEFYSGKVWNSTGYGEIEPGGKGLGSKKKIGACNLVEGDQLEYVYDFGDDIQHIIVLEKIIPSEDTDYPRVVGRNKPKYHYCEVCKENDKKVVATWICVECIEYLCEDCLDDHDEECFVEEITY
jgi:hypothetical protein